MNSDNITFITNPAQSYNSATNCILRFVRLTAKKMGHRVETRFIWNERTQDMTVRLSAVLVNPPSVNRVSFTVTKSDYESKINDVLVTTDVALKQLVDGYNQAGRK